MNLCLELLLDCRNVATFDLRIHEILDLLICLTLEEILAEEIGMRGVLILDFDLRILLL